MRKRRNWLKTTIAMLTLIATVLETGFSSVSTLAAEIQTEDGIIVNNDAIEDSYVDSDAGNSDDLSISVERDADSQPEETVDSFVQEENTINYEQEEQFEEAAELKEGSLDVTDNGITGSGYNEISIYVDTENLSYRKSFRIEFFGPSDASYNTIINDDLFKTNDGRYDFENLKGEEFTVRATSEDKVILSYRYNEDGYPTIVVENEPVEKKLEKKTVYFEDGTEAAAITGQGYESLKLNFNTEELSDKASYKLVVDSEVEPKVDGEDATKGIKGLDNTLASLVVEDLEEEEFTAYILSDNKEIEIQALADIDNVEDGEATFTVDNVDVKRVYEYEDEKVKVTATLQRADAVPDDAFFAVTALTEEEAAKYLEALNKDRGEDEILATSENTLLYDIGFYTDETKEVELEPEEGSVTVSIEFKKDQLTEEIGAVDSEDIVVTHITEEGNDITTEVVADSEAVVEEGIVEFTTDSFSLYAITQTKDLKFETGTKRDFKAALGQNANYGLVSNYIKIVGHMETNFATKVLDGGDGIQSCKNNGGGTGYTYIADYKGNYLKMTGNNNTGNVVIYTTPEAASNFNYNNAQDGTLVDTTSYTKKMIEDLVDDLLDEAKENSAEMYAEKNYYDFSEFKDMINTNPGDKMYALNLKDKGSGAGTYYFRFAPGEFGSWANNDNGLKITISNDQTVVFNIPDTTVSLKKNISLVIDNKPYSSSGDVTEMAQHLIYNMPYAKTVTFDGNVDGTFICPEAEASVNVTSGGWLVADSIPKVGSAEWHATWPGIPKTENDKKDYEFKINKIFEDIAGSETSHWPKDGFEFTIEEYTRRDGVNQQNSGAPMPPENKIVITKGADGRTNSGSFGKIFFDAEKYFKIGQKEGQWSSVYPTGIWPVVEGHSLNYMYLIKETVPSDAVDYVGKDGNKVYYQDKLDKDWWGNGKWKIKYKVKDGVVYDCEPWTLKIWVNVGYVHTPGGGYRYEIAISANTKHDHEDGCSGEPGHPITFTNKYEGPTEVPITFDGIKYVNKSDKNIPDNKFEFTLYQYTNGNTFNTAIRKATNKGAEVKFDDPVKVKFGAGTENDGTHSVYYFLIQETRCDEPYVKDEGSTIAKVTVTKNGENYTPAVEYYRFEKDQTIDVQKARDGEASFRYSTSKFKFWNTIDAEGKVTIPVQKMIQNRNPKADDEFEFTLEADPDYNGPQDTHNGLPKNLVIKVKNGQIEADKKFELTYTSDVDKNKEYHYIVKEIRSKNTLTFSTDPIPVTVTVGDFKKDRNGNYVKNTDGSYQLDIHVSPCKALTFTNIYDTKDGIRFKALKAYEDDCTLSDDQQFSFVLKKKEGNAYVNVATKSGSKASPALFYQDGVNDGFTRVYTSDELKNLANGTLTEEYSLEESHGDATYVEDLGKYVDAQGIMYDPRILYVTVTAKYDKADGSITITKNGKYVHQVTKAEEVADLGDEISFITGTFKNDYNPNPTKGKVEGTKELTGRELKDGEFEFLLEADTSDSATKNALDNGWLVVPVTKDGKYIVSNNGANITFDNIEFSRTGTYWFKVSEVKGTNDKIRYSEEIYKAKIVVTKSDGKLVAADAVYFDLNGSQLQGGAIFHNDEMGDGQIQFHAIKYVIKGTEKEAAAEGKFTFELYKKADANDTTGTLIETLSNKANGLVDFAPITYYNNNEQNPATTNFEKNLGLKEGESTDFFYMIKEKVPENAVQDTEDSSKYWLNGVSYSEQTKNIKVTVSLVRENGVLKLQTVADPDTVLARVEFENESIPQETYWGIDGTKTLLGREFDSNDQFFANLYESDQNFNLATAGDPIDSVQIVPTGKHDAKFEFVKGTNEKRHYTSEGVHYYIITESEGDKGNKNTSNDDILYLVTVTVTTVNGKLVANESINYTRPGATEDPQSTNDISFVNRYVRPATAEIEAVKTLNGQELEEKQFTFTLKEFGKKDPTATLKSVEKTNLAGGRVLFTPDDKGMCGDIKLSYDLQDVADSPYLFTITEKIGNGSYTYDSHVYGAAVVLSVADEVDGNGDTVKTVKTNVKYYDFAGMTEDQVPAAFKDWADHECDIKAVKFTNEYHAYGELSLPALKKFTGGQLTAGQFKFNLREKKKNADGTVTLGPVSYVDVYGPSDAGHSKGDVIEGKPAVTIPQALSGEPEYSLIGNTIKARAQFDKIKYSQADLSDKTSFKENGKYVKYYLMNEVNEQGTYPYISYDTTLYTIRVELNVDDNGNIDPVWTFATDAVDPEEDNFWQKIGHWITRDMLETYVPTFENTYSAQGSVILAVKKALTGMDYPEAGFSFELKDKDGNVLQTKNTNDFTADENGVVTVEFDAIDYDKSGSYKYTINEVVSETAKRNGGKSLGITYDLSEYEVLVRMVDNGTGGLVVGDESTITKKGESASSLTAVKVDLKDADGKIVKTTYPVATFSNSYIPNPTTVTIGGNKVLVGRKLKAGEAFSFTMKAVSYTDPATGETTIKNVGNKPYEDTQTAVFDPADPHKGSFTFADITITPEDMLKADPDGSLAKTGGRYVAKRTFKFEITEVKPADVDTTTGYSKSNDTTYDLNTYEIYVVAFSGAGQISAYATGENGQAIGAGTDTYFKAPNAVTFVNQSGDDVVLMVQKEVISADDDDDTQFRFILTDKQDSDTAIKDNNGKSFELYLKNGETGSFLQSIDDKNFEEYTFKYYTEDQIGTYTYYVKEYVKSDETKDYYEYSKTVYAVDITVAKDSENNIKATQKVRAVADDTETDTEKSVGVKVLHPEFFDAQGQYKAGEKSPVMLFINRYNANCGVELPGWKVLKTYATEKKKIVEVAEANVPTDKFTFELWEADATGKAIGTSPIMTTKNDATGKFSFVLPDTTFDQDDAKPGQNRFFYRVIEQKPAGYDANTNATFDGFTYTPTEYVAVVGVNPVKNEKGKIEAKVLNYIEINTDQDQILKPIKYVLKDIEDYRNNNGAAMVFVNEYDSECEIDPPILTKKLLGREPVRGEFSFHISGAYVADDAKAIAGNLNEKSNLRNDLRDEIMREQDVKNGLTPEGNDYFYDKDGVKHTLDPYELYVGNISYKYADLDKEHPENNNFVYVATENDTKNPDVDYSDAKFYLFVNCEDQGNGKIKVTPSAGHGKDGKLAWEFYDQAQGKFVPILDTQDDMYHFKNTYNAKTSITLDGIKDIEGRAMLKDDIFKFDIEHEFNGKKDKVEGIENKRAATATSEAPKLIEFTHDNTIIDQNTDRSLLDFEWGVVKDANGDVVMETDSTGKTVPKEVNDIGLHTYTIREQKYDSNGVKSAPYYYKVYVDVVLVDKNGNPITPDIYTPGSYLKATVKTVEKYNTEDDKLLGTHDVTVDSKDLKNLKFTCFTFINPFEAHTDIEFAGHKTIQDISDKSVVSEDLTGKYTFELVEYPDNTGKGGKVIASATTDKNGDYLIVPKAADPTKKGFYDEKDMKVGNKDYTNDPDGRKFYYTIREVKPSNGTWIDNETFESNGVIYDNDEYDFTVTLKYVADPANNNNYKLQAEVTSLARRRFNTAVALWPDKIKDLNHPMRTVGYNFYNGVRPYVERHGKKIWKDNISDDSKHVEVTINLLRNGVKINETKATYATKWAYSFTTDQNGNPLPACDTKGKSYSYTVEENKVPGYDSSVVVNPDGSIDFINTKGDIKIKKIDADTGAELAGATLAIYDGNTEIERWVSEVSPHVVTSALTAGKTYTLKELQVPEGYEIADPVNFVAPTDGKEITVTMSDKPIVGSVRLIKADASTRERLAGAEFALYTEAGARVYASGSTGSYTYSKSSSNGVFVVDSTGALTIADLPYGTYYFEETRAPRGYRLSSERLGFTIVRSGALVEVTYLNTPALGSVRLRKVGSAGTGGLAGAAFELYSRTPRTAGQAAASTIFTDAYYRVGTYYSDSDGYIYVDDLKWDDYYFIEVDPPTGYELATDVNGDSLVYTFTIDESSADMTIDLGAVTNVPEEPPTTPTPTPGVLGERVKRGGVVNGVLGVRSKPTAGVLGERIGPVTGDASNIILWLLLLTACAATIVATVLTGRKKKAAK